MGADISQDHQVAVFKTKGLKLLHIAKSGGSVILSSCWISNMDFVIVGPKNYQHWQNGSGGNVPGKYKNKKGQLSKVKDDKLLCCHFDATKSVQKVLVGSVKGNLQVWNGVSCQKEHKKLHRKGIDAIYSNETLYHFPAVFSPFPKYFHWWPR